MKHFIIAAFIQSNERRIMTLSFFLIDIYQAVNQSNTFAAPF
jgi:hypothetical protein